MPYDYSSKFGPNSDPRLWGSGHWVGPGGYVVSSGWGPTGNPRVPTEVLFTNSPKLDRYEALPHAGPVYPTHEAVKKTSVVSAPVITTPTQEAAWDQALAAMSRPLRAWAGPQRPAIPARVATLPADEIATLQFTANPYGANGRGSLTIYHLSRGLFAELPVHSMRAPR